MVDFHPAYHQLMAMGFGHGVHALSWTANKPGSHLARAVQSYLWNQIDGATACPTGMSYAAIPTLRKTPQLAVFADRVSQHGYDPAYAPVETKTAATDREQLKSAIQQQDGAVRALRSALDETNQKVATLSVPPPVPVRTARQPMAEATPTFSAPCGRVTGSPSARA